MKVERMQRQEDARARLPGGCHAPVEPAIQQAPPGAASVSLAIWPDMALPASGDQPKELHMAEARFLPPR